MRALLLILTLTTVPALAAPSYMIGTWFGTGQPNDRSSMYVDRMRPNGSWRGEYRTCVKGKAEDLVQQGSWSLNGDMETIQIQTVGGQFFPRTDYYAILAHDGKSQSYRYLATGFTYTSKRVDAKFQMPACDLVS